jgi:16S rRNA (cytosine967-C5)-methyltransferase
VQENCARLGITIVDGLVADGRSVQLERPADRVLVDAPCSGLGVLGRRSDARWNKAEDDLPRLHALQVELLEHAATLLKPGGRLVYSTCTVEPLENDATVEVFLRDHPEYRVLPPSNRIPAALVDDRGYYRTWPHRHGMGGAFGAILVSAPAPGTPRQEAPPDEA